MSNWNANTVPQCKKNDCSDEVLVTVDNGYRKRVVKAVYFPYHNATVEDMAWDMNDGIPDDWEYYEEDDTWWIPEGWYEVADYIEDYSYAWIGDKVLAWQKLPKVYEPKIKQINAGLVESVLPQEVRYLKLELNFDNYTHAVIGLLGQKFVPCVDITLSDRVWAMVS